MKFAPLIKIVTGVFGLLVSSNGFGCEPSETAYVCGLRNAEDLIRLGASPWVVVSYVRSNDDFGPLHAVQIDTHEVVQLYPSANDSPDWDRKLYPDCPTPPQRISSHGLNLRPIGPDKYRLYVVNHGERESVEIIDVTLRRQRLSPTWRGCVRLPRRSSGNGVTPLSGDGLAVSGGSVMTWHPSRGWRRIEGIDDGNGIEASRDGRWLFVARYRKLTVARVSVAGGAIQTVLQGDFHPDNLRWSDDGRLYVTGHVRGDARMAACHERTTPICDGAFVIAQIDPETLTAKEILRNAGVEGRFGGGTTTLRIGDRFWVGTFWGDRIAILDARPGAAN